jgi:antirestriction protein ArdC
MSHDSKWWGTYKQWQSLGGQVRRGETSVMGIIYKPIKKESISEDGEIEKSSFALLKTFNLFHISQIEGDLVQFRDSPVTESESTFVDYGPAEDAFRLTGAEVRFVGSRAYYSPSEDFIQLPPKSAFDPNQYYSVLAHEFIHWTGHESRLHRLEKFSRFGSEAYAAEELTAEPGSALLSNDPGVPQSDDLSNVTAYLSNWLKVLKRDHSDIFSVASAASKAADFVLSCSRPAETSESESETEAVAI